MMFEYFFNFYKKPLGWNLFSRDAEDGTPSPPESETRITDDSVIRITDSGQVRITD
jgi:hypothetical protein